MHKMFLSWSELTFTSSNFSIVQINIEQIDIHTPYMT